MYCCHDRAPENASTHKGMLINLDSRSGQLPLLGLPCGQTMFKRFPKNQKKLEMRQEEVASLRASKKETIFGAPCDNIFPT
jgi:hypothetical protein